jgi:methionyl-tRNA formyltransferase
MKESIKIIFMGTPAFAVPTLDKLVHSVYEVVAVVTAPDRPAGRGRQLSVSAVKQYALDNNIPVLQPLNLKADSFHRELNVFNANLYIVVAFRMLPVEVWQRPKLGTFNLHASLLPNYRGAAPINWAIINGEKETGLTTFFIDEKIDTGTIISQEKVAISRNDTVGSLHDRLMELGAELVLSTVDKIQTGNYTLQDQDHTLPSSIRAAPKLTKAICKIDWAAPASDVVNFIRGLSPYPGAWSELKHQTNGNILSFKVLDCTFMSSETINGDAGKLAGDKKKEFIVTSSSGQLRIDELQLAGKRKMKTEELLRGFNLSDYQLNT